VGIATGPDLGRIASSAAAGSSGARFLVNATFGLGGAVDVASSMGFETRPTDFGLTLQRWGVAPGPYLEIPLAGPTTLRDGVGRLVDTALDPTRAILATDLARQRAGQAGVMGRAAIRYGATDEIDAILYESPDSYTAVRDGYLAERRDERIDERLSNRPIFLPEEELRRIVRLPRAD